MDVSSKSESIINLIKALVAFRGEEVSYKKGATNPYFRSKYTPLEDLVEAVTPALNRHGLTIAQFPSGDCGLTTYLLHTSGEYLMHTTTLAPAERNPQALGSAITYMRRYSLQAVLGIAADTDDDAEVAMGRAGSKEPPVAGSKPWLGNKRNGI